VQAKSGFDYQTANQTHRRIPAAHSARVFAINIRPKKQRAWGMPGARRTRSLVCEE